MTTQKEIIKLDEDAKTLVNNLQVLHNRVGSYEVAKESLEVTRSTLEEFIKETRELAQQSHRTIEILNKIGSGKIFKRLGVIEKSTKRNFIFLTTGLSLVVILQILMLILK